MPRAKKAAPKRSSRSKTARKSTARKNTARKATARKATPRRPARRSSQFVCDDCGFVAAHAMGLGRHRSARHGAVSKRQARAKVEPVTPGWLTRQQAAQRAGVHYNTIRIWERSGLIRTQKRGARGVLSADDLDRVVRDRGAGGTPPGPAGSSSGADVAALERRFETLLDGLERLVSSARSAEPRRRPGRPLGSRNKPKTGSKTPKQAASAGRSKRSTVKRAGSKARSGRRKTRR